MRTLSRYEFLFFGLTFFVPFSSAHAVDIDVNDAGSLYAITAGKKDILWPGFELHQMYTQTYVIKRAGVQYIIRESFTNDRALVAIPVIDDNGEPSIQQFMYFSRNFTASTEQGRDVRVGSEISVTKPLHLRGLKWEDLNHFIGALSRKKAGKRPAFSESRVTTPAFFKTPVAVFSEDGDFIMTKQYIDRSDDTWNIYDTVCAENCDRPDSFTDGDYIGAIGNLPVTLSIHLIDGKIEGTYRYSKKSRDAKLFLQGSVLDDGSLHIIEYPQKSQSRSTGSFDASLVDGIWRGTWKSADATKTLSFFAVPATL
jgi:hypothetical protein